MYACRIRTATSRLARALPQAQARRCIATLNSRAHTPVLLEEAISNVSAGSADKQRTKLFCDATFGNGGYTKRLLDSLDCRVIAIDQDPEAYERARLMASLPEYQDRLLPVHGKFGDLIPLIHETLGVGSASLDGILFDIGLSSNQLDSPSRGFSFRTTSPLDMRMNASGNVSNNSPALHNSLTAEAIVNNFAESELADIIYTYGEERKSRAIARAIVSARKNAPITTTTRLAEIVSGVVGARGSVSAHRGEAVKHPAVRTFQALRIYINDELKQLEAGLRAAEHLLLPGGALVVVTFHSLEDRIAKQFLLRCATTASAAGQAQSADEAPPFREMDALDIDLMHRRGADGQSSDTDLLKLKGRRRREKIEQKALRHKSWEDAWSEESTAPSFKLVTRRTVAPTRNEVDANPRARSAKLRAAIRTAAPPLSRL
ncbi:hypothetical protein HDU89_003809 [Geranomyces variabilis]|nr:hypothetical protein HDU89_003809 [Geranomyces variabilis]